ncbi:MAG: hypothetical protein CSB55_07680 [Candidatus Cloacimonadota bacterium]|nr:MAG: hypothetical protein CSB55_07680 [Candidatus Cloacimonadota bacterium]
MLKNYKIILWGFLLISSLLFADSDKLFLNKQLDHKLKEHKVSYVQKVLGGARDRNELKTRDGKDKLLIMLVEFQEEIVDDPKTTGRGLFLKEGDPYPIHLGSPPHDQIFYDFHAQGLQQYYKSVTWGEYEFDFEIYPKKNGTYYKLPHKMSYYHDPSLDPDLTVARFEQYFRDIFQTVDKDSSVVFADYDHFMVIHAGSEYQHDVKSDSPSDIPSFFIKMGSGKEVTVDDGQTKVSYLCNIPEMITQDVTSKKNEDGIEIVSGAGLINAVMAHEFGHSLGFVDLYNTRKNTPSVGYFDIMDSGGQSLLSYPVDADGNQVFTMDEADKIYGVEGGLPAQPGAWSKALVWEDEFRARGILKDYSEFDLDQPIEILTNSNMVETIGSQQAYIVKFPLSEYEYVLIENRETDPDGDGGSSLVGGLDHRVIMYPSYLGSDNSPNHEYDYNLPGWISKDGYAVGGGLLFWKADNYEMFEKGISYADGSWQSNFESNRVNTNFYRKGVEIIEGDGYFDIGNPNSYVWSGSPYEYIFPFKPEFNEYNKFERWYTASDTASFAELDPDSLFKARLKKIHTLKLSAVTKPALETYNHEPSGFEFSDFYSANYDDYHNPAEKISFRLRQNSYDKSQVVIESEEPVQIGEIAKFNAPFSEWQEAMFTVFRNDSSFVYERNPKNDQYDFLEPAVPTKLNYEFRPVKIKNPNTGLFGQTVVSENKVYITEDLYTYEEINLGEFAENESIVCEPLILYFQNMRYAVVLTDLATYIHNFATSETEKINEVYENAAYSEPKDELLLVGKNISVYSFGENKLYAVQENFAYQSGDPVGIFNVKKDKLNWFLFDSSGRLIKICDKSAEPIFTVQEDTDFLPTQLAAGYTDDTNAPYLIFGINNKIYAVRTDGSLKTGFPKLAEFHQLKPGGYPYILNIEDSEDGLITRLMVFPTQNNGYLAYDGFGNYRADYSYAFPTLNSNYNLFYSDESNSLNFLYVEKSINITENSSEKYRVKIAQKFLGKNPVIWSGFRNNGTGLFICDTDETQPENEEFQAYVFPHPINSDIGRLRVYGHDADIDVKIYDIAGNKVFEKKYAYIRNQQDLEIDFSDFASGVYFGLIKSGNKSKKIPVAVEK